MLATHTRYGWAVAVFLIGIYAIVFGGALVGLGLRLRRLNHATGRVPETRRPATA